MNATLVKPFIWGARTIPAGATGQIRISTGWIESGLSFHQIDFPGYGLATVPADLCQMHDGPAPMPITDPVEAERDAIMTIVKMHRDTHAIQIDYRNPNCRLSVERRAARDALNDVIDALLARWNRAAE